MFVNYAHRGASEYMPENTMSSFYTGLQMGANGIETDVQKTKDGKLVLFHDDTLERVTGKPGSIADYTYEELLQFRVHNYEYNKSDIIVLFDDFLKYFGFMELTFAIELKVRNIEADVLGLINKYGLKDKAIITSFELENIKGVKKLCPEQMTGWLQVDFDEDKIKEMKAIGVEQICPKAVEATAEKIKQWKNMGFSVRAWGVENIDILKMAYDNGVGGMTVNFPDKLTEYMKGAE